MIGKWIKESREAKGLSQNQLAELMCTTRQCISHYENGRRQSPSLEVLKEFSRVLDLNLLIEKGEVIKMNKETGVVQTIDEFRNRLEQQFKYTNQITIEELVGQVMSLAEEEFEVKYPTWRAFLPKELLPDVENPKEEDWLTYFTNPDFGWGRFEFDIEFRGGNYIQGISFKMKNPKCFAEIMMGFLPQTDEEWEEFSDIYLWTDVVREAIYSTLGDELFGLIISDIQIEQ